MKKRDTEDLYSRFGHQVYRRCKVLLKEEAAAMDMTQEVFVKALGRPLRFVSDGQAVRWLTRVATNLSLNELRRRRYWRSEEISERTGGGPALVEQLAADRDRVRQVLAIVDLETGQAGIGYFLEGRTAAEISKILGVSVPTVRRRLKRFLEIARRTLNAGGAT